MTSIGTQAVPVVQKQTPDNGAINTRAWHHVAVVGDGTTVTAIYIDGNPVTVSNYANPGNISNTTVSGLSIGRRNDNARYFNGSIDEVRFSNMPRSSDWIKAQYNNHSSPATFYTISAAAGTGSADVRWLIADHLGTPRMVFDQTGSLANMKRHDYLPFGEELVAPTSGRSAAQGYAGGDGVRQQFTLKERDIETGLDYLLARYYSSTLGRFTSVDPSRKSIVRSDPQSWNRYTYAKNNPLTYVDENGKWPTSIHNLIIDRALPGLSQWERQQIKDGSWFVDDPIQGGQHTANSNNHGMTKPVQTQEDATSRADNYINNHVDMAQDHLARGFIAWSLFFFGNAFHTVSDMTSPAHEGYQIWRKRETFLHRDTEKDISPFRLGLAVGATIRLYRYTYGPQALQRAVNYTPGSENDPSVMAIRNQFSLPGSDPRAEAEALYEYRLGLQEGLDFDWATQRGRKGRRQSERPVANK